MFHFIFPKYGLPNLKPDILRLRLSFYQNCRGGLATAPV
ncbi:Uncharacterized protein dnm_073960 [Desulfonema magnum]|uniref:Uncharacterized protein n=1 Tax=Desulfonema magnum TaxID=45655 RepID=A0A975GRR2_9BACT|nr:Uncharacterized protein dnm_073960 [Desulfonema magnum]